MEKGVIMQGIWRGMLAAGFLALALTSDAWAGAEVGSPAPDFCLPSSQGEKVCLKDFKGKDNVVLLFYILDFTPG
jgi:cytochrome oxidase Cu insertion factor (SCO1/SenC/PrrC family)